MGDIHHDDLKEKDEFFIFFKIVLGKELNKLKRRPLPFLLSLSFFYGSQIDLNCIFETQSNYLFKNFCIGNLCALVTEASELTCD